MTVEAFRVLLEAMKVIIEAVRKIIEAVRLFVEAVRLLVEAGRVPDYVHYFTIVPPTFSFAQLAKGKSLGRSKPTTNSQIQALATHCVDYFYYIQALLNCLL